MTDEIDFDKTIESLFKQMLEAEDEISKRQSQIDVINGDARRKISLLTPIIEENEVLVDQLRIDIITLMQEYGVESQKVSGFTLRPKKAKQSVVIIDESQISGNYITTKIPAVVTAPDKLLIGKLLREGQEVAGARLSDEEYTLEIKAK